MAYLYILEGANLFSGSEDNSIILETVKIPDMEEIVASFHSAASYGALEIGGLGLKELMIPFKVGGVDPLNMITFGLFGVANISWTIYGAVRDKVDNTLSQLKAIAVGRVKKISPDTYKRGDLFGMTYDISEISHYELYFDGQELYFYDFYNHIWRVNGVDQVGPVNNALGLGG